jgi:hypothetical protein
LWDFDVRSTNKISKLEAKMAMFTQTNLPITHTFNGAGGQKRITCQVTASNIHITIKKNGNKIHDGDYGANVQGYSDFLDTNVDSAAWEVKVTGTPLCVFALTAPD